LKVVFTPPETKYVTVSGAEVAYQVIGEGPRDLLVFYGLGSHVELMWDLPPMANLWMGLASFNRLILFDRRGTGASDPVARDAVPTWEEWTEDVRAVLDATGSQRSALLATADAGPIAMLFAAMHPERLTHLILINPTARALEDDDFPIGMSPEGVDSLIAMIEASWGTPDLARAISPSWADDAEFVRLSARTLRAAATPQAAAAQYDYFISQLDARKALPLISAPTLVLHTKENPFISIDHGRYVAEHIPGAKFIELEGAEATPHGPEVIEEVAEFLTGERPVVEIERILTTVLFTDIVGSTERAASLGDQRWRTLLDSHDRVVRDQLRRFRGREINTTGDGFVACFEGPARAISCARALVDATKDLGIELRIGLHTGECEVRGDDLGGLAVHIAARVGASAGPGEVFVSGTVKDLVIGSGIEFTERGDSELKGVPGSWKLFSVNP
jgi:class 3 adenylate cyclase/alpha-beta hydrolase superfamily lysophospholipase